VREEGCRKIGEEGSYSDLTRGNSW